MNTRDVNIRDDFGLSAVVGELARRGAGGFEWYKDSCLVRRIEVRMRARGAPTLLAYAAVLHGDDEEVGRLLHTLSVRVTEFCRNADSWQRLRELLESERTGAAGGSITAWSMGCATGEEAWTIAMLLLDHATQARTPPRDKLRVFASDVDAQALDTARMGRYLPQAALAVRAVLTRSYGTVGQLGFEVDAALRPMVSFRREDLTAVLVPPDACDLVCCRNLLIFLGREGQRRVLDAARRALVPGGLLMLGRTESLVALPEAGLGLVPVDITHRIYRRVP